jgi:hypothetical protein
VAVTGHSADDRWTNEGNEIEKAAWPERHFWVGELSSSSFSVFPVIRWGWLRDWLLMLCSMEEKAGRTEDQAASATGFRVGFTQLSPTVRALRAGRSWAGKSKFIGWIPHFNDFQEFIFIPSHRPNDPKSAAPFICFLTDRWTYLNPALA